MSAPNSDDESAFLVDALADFVYATSLGDLPGAIRLIARRSAISS
jgi:hypothetical protein